MHVHGEAGGVAGYSDAEAGFRDWYQKRYGADFGGEGSIRLVPMDLWEAWGAAWAQAREVSG
jgi:hypothetical protein